MQVRDPLKTAPRGYPKDHPRVELLRGKGLTAGQEFPIRKWLHTAAVRERVVADVVGGPAAERLARAQRRPEHGTAARTRLTRGARRPAV